jgi:hypothetical protein
MKRLPSWSAWLPLLALAAAACGPNITPLGDDHFKFTMLGDFESGQSFNPDPLWDGNFAHYTDGSAMPKGYDMTFAFPMLSPPRIGPDGSMSTRALHAAEEGRFTVWGTLVYADLNQKRAVDLSRFVGFSIWARSAGQSGQTVKVAFADWGSSVDIAGAPVLCDTVNATGPNACYDDYATKIYPDGEWRRYDIPFASLSTGGWGYPHPFDLHRVYRLKIALAASTAYDLWFDDAAFYTTGAK